MPTLRVQDVLTEKILISRESARVLEDALKSMTDAAKTAGQTSEPPPVTVDFLGVVGISPSFLDELLSIFESVMGDKTNGGRRRLIVAHPPTRLSLKFEAVGRGHGMSVQAMPDGSWLLEHVKTAGEN